MNKRLLLHIIAPTIAISVLLFSLGILAAWNVQRQQASVSELVNLEFHNTLAAQKLLLVVNDVRQLLRQYIRNQDEEVLDQIDRLKSVLEERLQQLHECATSAETKEGLLVGETSLQIWEKLDQGKTEFFQQLQKVSNMTSAERKEGAFLLDDILNEKIQKPTGEYVGSNEQAADRTNEANRQTANKMFEAFLLLGVCGGAGGLVAGLAIARGVRRSMVKLDVSVRGAADKLQEVIGPVKISSTGGAGDLAAGLKQVEAQIELVIERLHQRELESMRSQKFAAVGQLAAGLAHELRNPLMPMKMLVQRALSRPDGPSLSQQQLRVLDEEIRRLESLVQEFLDFAKPQALQRQQIDITQAIRQAMELVVARANVQNVRLICHWPEKGIEVNADPLRIRQVILNLLLNSLDAQPEGGEIEIFFEEQATDEQGSETKWVLIRVIDSGPGISPDVLETIFEPFVSTKETGTGLGLPISKRIIQSHGGQLSGSNLAGRGAEFLILLPHVSPLTEQPELVELFS